MSGVQVSSFRVDDVRSLVCLDCYVCRKQFKKGEMIVTYREGDYVRQFHAKCFNHWSDTRK